MSPYYLTFWGQIQNDGLAEKFLKTSATEFWFSTAQERDSFRERLEKFAKDNGKIIAFTCYEGEDAKYETVTEMLIQKDEEFHKLVYNFGTGYPAESAEYAFMEGNYACDCNISLFLKQQGVNIKEYPCGDNLKITEFKVNKVKIKENK